MADLDDAAQYAIDQAASVSAHRARSLEEERREEIEAYARALKGLGITLRQVQQACPRHQSTRALCLHGDRGRQADAAHCPRYCENNVILYPAHLKMLGRWNSLLALDSSLAALCEPARFDRWVLNF